MDIMNIDKLKETLEKLNLQFSMIERNIEENNFVLENHYEYLEHVRMLANAKVDKSTTKENQNFMEDLSYIKYREYIIYRDYIENLKSLQNNLIKLKEEKVEEIEFCKKHIGIIEGRK